MHFPSRYTNFGTHSKFATISKLGRSVVEQNGGINFRKEMLDDRL